MRRQGKNSSRLRSRSTRVLGPGPVAAGEAGVIVICLRCEHEWLGPADGPCPRCGCNPEDSGTLGASADEHVVRYRPV